MRIIIYGPQGSGKSTQATLLSEKLHLPVISAGEISRLIAEENSPEGKHVKELMDRGEPTPTEIIAPRIERALTAPSAQNGFILDGFPRYTDQIEQLAVIMDHLGSDIDRVFQIKLSEDEGIKRIMSRVATEGRKDDNPDAIGRRLQLYHQQTEPIISYFKKLGKLIEIDGSGSIEEVQLLISESLNNG